MDIHSLVGVRSRVAQVAEIKGGLYAQVVRGEKGQEHRAGVLRLSKPGQQDLATMIRNLTEFVAERARREMQPGTVTPRAKVLGAMDIVIHKLPQILGSSFPLILTFDQLIEDLVGFSSMGPTGTSRILALYSKLLTEPSLFFHVVQHHLMSAGVLNLQGTEPPSILVQVTLSGKANSTAISLSRPDAQSMFRRALAKETMGPEQTSHALAWALNMELLPQEGAALVDRILKEQERVRKEKASPKGPETEPKETQPAPSDREASPAPLATRQPKPATVTTEEGVEEPLTQIIGQVMGQMREELRSLLHEGKFEPFINSLRRLVSNADNARRALKILQFILRKAGDAPKIKRQTIAFVVESILNNKSAHAPDVFEEVLGLLNGIQKDHKGLGKEEIRSLMDASSTGYGHVGLFLEDVLAGMGEIDALALLREILVDEIETRAIGASGPYVRALNLVGTVTVQLDATDSIDEAVWFILESGFRQKKELSTSDQTQVIEEAPPVLEDTAIVGEDLLKVLIRSSRYSHLSKKEFLSAMMKKKIMGSKEEEE